MAGQRGEDRKRKPLPPTTAELHPKWRAFIRYCQELGHGDVERLRIQDGLPMAAEIVKEKIRFE